MNGIAKVTTRRSDELEPALRTHRCRALTDTTTSVYENQTSSAHKLLTLAQQSPSGKVWFVPVPIAQSASSAQREYSSTAVNCGSKISSNEQMLQIVLARPWSADHLAIRAAARAAAAAARSWIRSGPGVQDVL